MSSNDPTDQALAVIASIFDKPVERSVEEQPGSAVTSQDGGAAEATREQVSDDVAAQEQADGDAPESAIESSGDAGPPPDAPDAEADSEPDTEDYVRLGPGPLDALRFKWTMRRDDTGSYYVDETIGASSLPVSRGPMSRADAIAFIDQREQETVKRFETLRKEIVSGPSERGYQEGD